MSVLAPTALGLDASDGTLKAVLLRRQGRRVDLLRAWRLPWTQEPDLRHGRRLALRQFLNAARPGSGVTLVAAAPDRGHFAQTYQVPAMERERLADLVDYEVLAGSGAKAEDVVVLHHVRQGVVECQVHAVALRRDAIDAECAELDELAVPCDDLAAPSFALASFVEHELPLGRDRIVLAVGELVTHLLLMREDGLYSRHLPLGLGRVPDEAELGRRLHAETEAAVEHLLPPDRPFRPVDVVLSEEGALAPALARALRRAFDLPVTRVDELRRIHTVARTRLSGLDEAQVLSMGRAFGLALTGLGLARYAPPVLGPNPQRQAARRLPQVAISLAVAALALLGVTQLAERRVDLLERALPASLAADVGGNAERAGRQAAELAVLDGRSQRLDELVSRRRAALAVRPVLAAFASVASQRGEATLHVESLWLRPGGSGVPARLELRLSASPRFDEELPGLVSGPLDETGLPWTLDGPDHDPSRDHAVWTLEVALP